MGVMWQMFIMQRRPVRRQKGWLMKRHKWNRKIVEGNMRERESWETLCIHPQRTWKGSWCFPDTQTTLPLQ
jgi:hypothetical protein